ncbi:hypothetical protein PM082_020584 [Marasmius tenuissimus]|nr:hypothetical protein PM082_020584 [Marasmius tenuissimus]
MFLPPEILLRIFEELSEFDLHSCALVCRSWVPASRFHGFHILRLDLDLTKPTSALRFLELCNSPFETFTAAGVRTLVIKHHYTEWTTRGHQVLTLEQIWRWRSSDTERSISNILSRIRCLHLHHLDWDASARLPREIFGSVKELQLYYTRFSTHDAFLNVLGSIKALETFEMTGCVGPFGYAPTDDKGTASEELAFRATLRTVTLHSVKDAKLVGLLIPCPGLRTLRVTLHSSLTPFDDARVVAEVRGLMAAARSSLNSMKLDLTGSSAIRELTSSLEEDPLANYPRLRRLEILSADNELVPFLNIISQGEWKPDSPSPLVTLKIPSLNSRKTSLEWRTLDDILQRPYFRSLEQLVPQFYVSFRSGDVSRQPKALSYAAPDPSSPVEVMLQAEILRLNEHLPKCFERALFAFKSTRSARHTQSLKQAAATTDTSSSDYTLISYDIYTAIESFREEGFLAVSKTTMKAGAPLGARIGIGMQ